jgi:hypothetical protein
MIDIAPGGNLKNWDELEESKMAVLLRIRRLGLDPCLAGALEQDLHVMP